MDSDREFREELMTTTSMLYEELRVLNNFNIGLSRDDLQKMSQYSSLPPLLKIDNDEIARFELIILTNAKFEEENDRFGEVMDRVMEQKRDEELDHMQWRVDGGMSPYSTDEEDDEDPAPLERLGPRVMARVNQKNILPGSSPDVPFLRPRKQCK